MRGMDVKAEDRLTPKIKKAQKQFPGLGNYIAYRLSKELAEYIRSRKLSGQVLRKISGETFESTRFFKIKSGIFGVRPGVGIRGRLNYLYRFERGRRAFMGPGAKEFFASAEVEKIESRALAGFVKRLEK